MGETVDLELERIDRTAKDAAGVTPEQILRIALRDCKEAGNVRACYVTLIHAKKTGESLSDYRSNLNRAEEVGYRQLGVQANIKDWANQ